MVSKCLIALGANLPTATRTPLEVLRYALELLEDESFDLAAVSEWYSTPAFPVGSGPDYVNAVALFHTDLGPQAVLQRLAETETKMGRARNKRWDARVCDLDLLSYDDRVLPDTKTYEYWSELPLNQQKTKTPDNLILPHPRIKDRAFVLVPLKDVAPEWHHPVTGERINALINALPSADVEAIRPIQIPPK